MSLDPVVVSVDVPLSPADAHRLFTEGMTTWWPMASHSIFEDRAAAVRFPSQAGDHIIEVSTDGDEAVWGTLLEDEPGSTLRFTWHPGRPAETAQEIEVVFVPTDAGTRLTLTHSDWEVLGDHEMRAGYDTGWVLVLAGYVRTASTGG